MRSTIDVKPDCLSDIIAMLKQFDIRVVGSKEAEGMVCLTIEGPIVLDTPKVVVGVQLTVRGPIAMLTASCETVADVQQG